MNKLKTYETHVAVPTFVVVLAIALCALLLLASCGTPYVQQSETAYSHLMATIQAANADGVLTPEEVAQIDAAQRNYYTALKADLDASKGVDIWEAVGAAVAVFVPGSAGVVAAINAYRNSREKKMWGSPEQPKA